MMHGHHRQRVAGGQVDTLAEAPQGESDLFLRQRPEACLGGGGSYVDLFCPDPEMQGGVPPRGLGDGKEPVGVPEKLQPPCV
jgi:hypothetical protein